MWDLSELSERPRGIWPLATPVPTQGYLGWEGDTGLLGFCGGGDGVGGQGMGRDSSCHVVGVRGLSRTRSQHKPLVADTRFSTPVTGG